MKVLGLTGGIGMGKSASAQIALGWGIPVVDTDDLARRIVEPGQPALQEVRERFGDGIVDADDRLRRDKLARLVFADPAAREQLESILHPRIRDLWRAQVEVWRAQGRSAAMVVIPLLFETRAEQELDAVICVACSAETQRRRLLTRGWSADQIEKRIRAQWPAEKKMALADYIVWAEGSLDLHAAQLDRILRSIPEVLHQRAT
jgi:dephospho-CoA kinase